MFKFLHLLHHILSSHISQNISNCIQFFQSINNRKILFSLGLDSKDFLVAMLSLAILFIFDLKNKSYQTILNIKQFNIVSRWSIYYVCIFGIIIFGYYGGVTVSKFIYFQF